MRIRFFSLGQKILHKIIYKYLYNLNLIKIIKKEFETLSVFYSGTQNYSYACQSCQKLKFVSLN